MSVDVALKRFKKLLYSILPYLRDETHLPMKARVIAVHGDSGTPAIEGGPRFYSVDLEPLTPDGKPNDRIGTMMDVALDVPWGGPNRGAFCLPAVGSLVRVCFYGGLATQPYVDGILSSGHAVPNVQPGQFLLQQSPTQFVSLSPDHRLVVLLAGTAGENSMAITLSDDTNGGNLSIDLSAPSGGSLSINCTGNATVTATGDINLFTEGRVYAGGPGGEPLAKLGDVVVSGITPIGEIAPQSLFPFNGTQKVRGV